jgi:hypothetical protein
VGIKPAEVTLFITVLQTPFWNPDRVAIAERKLEALKETNSDFSSYYAEFEGYAAAIQWNDPATGTTLMRCLNNDIMNAFTQSPNFPEQFEEFVSVFQWLDNQIKAQKAAMEGKTSTNKYDYCPTSTTYHRVTLCRHRQTPLAHESQHQQKNLNT